MGNADTPSLSGLRASPDPRVEGCLFAVTALALGVSLALFMATSLHDSLSTWADNTLHPYGVPAAAFVVYAAAILSVILLGVLFHSVLRLVLYFSWALYLPSILAFSRFDLIGKWVDGGLASMGSGLPPVVVLAAGLLLVCTTLAQGAVEEHRALRKSYLERGADREEVDAAIRGSLKYVTLALAGSSALAALVAVATTGLAYFAGYISWPGGYWYLALAVAGGAVIAFVLVVLLRQGQQELREPGEAAAQKE